MALPRLRFFWLSRTLSKHIQTACLNLAKIQKPERHSHSCWGICNRKKSLMPLLGVNMRSFVSASMIHIRRSSNASVPNAWHKNKTQKHQKLWESARSARYCAQHCPALPSIAQPFCFQLWSRVTFTKAQALVLCCNCQFLLHRATWCHGAFHPVRKGEMQTATQPLNPLSHVWILAHITGSASKLLVEVDPEQNCRPKADDEDSLSRSSFFSSKINWFKTRTPFWLMIGARWQTLLRKWYSILMNQQTQKGGCLTKLTNYIILPYCWKCCFLCKLSVRTQPSCRSA